MKNLFQFSLALFFISLLNSCSFVSIFFVQNLKDEDVKIDIEFEHIINEEELKNIPSLFTSNVDNLKDFFNDEKKTKIEYKKVDERTISIILPKRSITKIDNTINKRTNITKIMITYINQTVEYERNELLKKSKFKRRGILLQLK